MWVILVWLLCSCGVIVERTLYLFGAHQNTDVFLATILQALKGSYNSHKAEALCTSAQTPLSRIIRGGLLRVGQGPEAVQAGLDERALDEFPRLRRRISYLPLFANLSMLSGLFGTIVGLIKSFGAVGGESVDPSQKARILAEGISEAMNCTAFGLLSAIASLVGYGLLSSYCRSLEEAIHRETVRFYNATQGPQKHNRRRSW